MSYSPHTWVDNETITAAKLNNLEDGVQEAAQSCGGLVIDAIAYFPNTTIGWQVEGNFASALAKMQEGKPIIAFYFDVSILTSGETYFGGMTSFSSERYDSSVSNIIDLAFNSYSGLVWTENGVEYYSND